MKYFVKNERKNKKVIVFISFAFKHTMLLKNQMIQAS